MGVSQYQNKLHYDDVNTIYLLFVLWTHLKTHFRLHVLVKNKGSHEVFLIWVCWITCLRVIRTYVLYVLTYVPACLCFVRAFIILRASMFLRAIGAFSILRALRALIFYVPYVSSFFTCLKCLHFFTWLHFIFSYIC